MEIGTRHSARPRRRTGVAAALALAALTVVAGAAPGGGAAARAREIIRGRNIVIMNDCNDCHTAGYARSGGRIPERRWLSGGDPEGLRGPWGVSHPPNLQAVAERLTEAQWIRLARSLKKRPPMPEHNLSDMSEGDLKALYLFIRSLGPARAGGAR